MAFFEILTFVVITTIILDKTNPTEPDPIPLDFDPFVTFPPDTEPFLLWETKTIEQVLIEKFDIDIINAINVTEIGEIYSGCWVNFGLYGVRQVVISIQNPRGTEGVIMVYVGETIIAKIDISSAIRIGSVDESLYVVSEMVDVPSGSQKLSVPVPVSYDYDYRGRRRDFDVKSISFIAKKLNNENPYMIISTSNDLGLTIKSWDHSRDKITPILYTSTCVDRQTFHFEENEMGQFRIIKIYKGMTENDVRYLEVQDASRKIGNDVILAKYPGSEDNVWSLLSGEIVGAVKIKSELTGTCISAVHGLGSNLVMVDCKNGMANEWYLKFCDG